MSDRLKQLGRLAFALALLISGGVLIHSQLANEPHSPLLIWIGVGEAAFGGYLLFPEDVREFFGLFSLPFLRRTPEPPESDDVPPTA